MTYKKIISFVILASLIISTIGPAYLFAIGSKQKYLRPPGGALIEKDEQEVVSLEPKYEEHLKKLVKEQEENIILAIKELSLKNPSLVITTTDIANEPRLLAKIFPLKKGIDFFLFATDPKLVSLALDDILDRLVEKGYLIKDKTGVMAEGNLLAEIFGLSINKINIIIAFEKQGVFSNEERRNKLGIKSVEAVRDLKDKGLLEELRGQPGNYILSKKGKEVLKIIQNKKNWIKLTLKEAIKKLKGYELEQLSIWGEKITFESVETGLNRGNLLAFEVKGNLVLIPSAVDNFKFPSVFSFFSTGLVSAIIDLSPKIHSLTINHEFFNSLIQISENQFVLAMIMVISSLIIEEKHPANTMPIEIFRKWPSLISNIVESI